MTTKRNPQLADAIRVGIDRRLAEVRTACVGVVETYAQGKADVQILRPDPVEQEDGTLVYVRGPVVRNVPIAFPGANGMRITFPVVKGDVVTLVFSDRELAQWLHTGREAQPESPRMFDVSDAIGFLGPQPFTASWTDNANALAMGKEGGPQIHIETAAIKLGDGATEAAILGDKLQTYLDALVLALSTFVTGLNSGTLTAQAATCATSLGTALTALKTYKSALVKVKA